MEPSKKRALAKEFDCEIRKIQAVIAFAIYGLSLVLLKLLYDSLLQISTFSLALVLTLLVIMLACSAVLFKRFSEKSVRKISALAEKLETLLNLTGDIRAEIHSDVLLRKILHSASEMTRADGGVIYTIEDDRLACRIALGDDVEKLKGSSLPLMEGITGWVVKSARVARMAPGKARAGGEAAITGLESFQFRSLLFAPMVSHSRVIGVIGLFSHREKGFEREDEALVSYFADHAAISLDHARYYEDQLNFETHISEILLQAMDDHLPIKRLHSENVARYSHFIGKAINLPFERGKMLHTASMLHDIGFIKFRPGMEADPKVIKQHCVAGYNMLKSIVCYRDVATIILHHHERYDGSGYPGKLKGEDIPLESRIITIAEAFDAMTCKTSYKKALTIVEALRELLRNAGTQFDPELVRTFINVLYREKLIPTMVDDAAKGGADRLDDLADGEPSTNEGAAGPMSPQLR